MGIIVDLILIACIILFIFVGYKKGLAGSLIKLCSFVIALILALALYKPVANAVKDNTQIDENIKSTIVETFGQQEQTQEENMPKDLVQNISSEIENATSEAVNNIAQSISDTIINIGAGIVIFIVARLLLIIVSIFAKQIVKLPIIGLVDKVGGIAYGTVEGIVIIYIVLGLISLSSLIWVDNAVVTAITNSGIGSFLYNNNIILKIFF